MSLSISVYDNPSLLFSDYNRPTYKDKTCIRSFIQIRLIEKVVRTQLHIKIQQKTNIR